MRILVVSDLYPPHYIGGYELACQNVVDCLRERGHEFYVLTSTYGVVGTSIENQTYRWLCYHSSLPSPSNSFLRLVSTEIRDNSVLRWLIHQVKPELAYVWNVRGLSKSLLITLQRLRVPTVYMIQDFWLEESISSDHWLSLWSRQSAGRFKQRVKSLLVSLGVEAALGRLVPTDPRELRIDHVSFVSHFNKTKTTAAGVRVKHPVVIHNGIETAKFRKREPDKHDGTLRLLYVGQLHAQKGVHTTVEAVRRLIVDGHQDIRLTIAGGAPLSETYEQYIHGLVATENLERYVQFLGHIPREHIVKAYHDHDVLLFTSIVERGFPLVLLEAMASGLAVVGTLSGGAADILVPGENCLTFSPGDASALAERIRALMADPQLRQRIARRGEELVRREFDLERIVDQVEAHLFSVLDGRLAV